MTTIQQESAIATSLSQMSDRLQQLARMYERSRRPTPDLLSENTAAAIARIENALLSLQVERIYQIAIASAVWDFYPTPASVVEKMIELAQVRPNMKMLEPSAGIGSICCSS